MTMQRLMLAALLVIAAAPAYAQAPGPWDTNTLVNDAHNLSEADLARIREQAGSGDAHAQVLLGLAYEMGSAGLMPDSVQALSWFTKAADQGIAWAQMWAGDFYYSGSPGVPKDLYKAIELYRTAAEHGEPRAAFFVGRMYFFGDGVKLNMPEAARWFHQAMSAEPAMVGRMVSLAELACDSPFCLSLRQVLGAMVTKSGDQYAGEWDDMTHEWDAVKELPEFDRCGFTSTDRTADGDVQNYFCDTEVLIDVAQGAAAATRVAADVEQALTPGWMRSGGSGDQQNIYFFTRDGYPRVRVSYNTTLGDAPQRVTLLVGP